MRKNPEWGVPFLSSPDINGSAFLERFPHADDCSERIPQFQFDIKEPIDFSRLMMPPTPEEQAAMKSLEDSFFKGLLEAIAAENEDIEKAVLHICRNYVTPPIKGELTRGKIRWRGLKIAYGNDGYGCYGFLGIIQRGWLIFPDGHKEKVNV